MQIRLLFADSSRQAESFLEYWNLEWFEKLLVSDSEIYRFFFGPVKFQNNIENKHDIHISFCQLIILGEKFTIYNCHFIKDKASQTFLF